MVKTDAGHDQRAAEVIAANVDFYRQIAAKYERQRTKDLGAPTLSTGPKRGHAKTERSFSLL
jgi:hypothetical protein